MKEKGIKLHTFTSVNKCSKHYDRKLTTRLGVIPNSPVRPSVLWKSPLAKHPAVTMCRSADVTFTSATCSDNKSYIS